MAIAARRVLSRFLGTSASARRIMARYLAKSAARMTEEEESELNERIALLTEAIRVAEDLVEDLNRDPDGEVADELKKLAQDMLDDMQTAETVDSVEDFDGNVKSAMKNCVALIDAVKKAKPKAKKGGFEATFDILDDAVEVLRQIKRDIDDAMPEE